MVIFTLYLTDANTAGDFFNILKISLPMRSIPIELRKFLCVKINSFKPGRFSSKRKYSQIDVKNKNKLFHQLESQKKEIAKNQTAFTEYIVSLLPFYTFKFLYFMFFLFYTFFCNIILAFPVDTYNIRGGFVFRWYY